MLSPRAVATAWVSVFLGGVIALVPYPARAHDALESSDPADGATVTSPSEVRLEFSGPLLDIGASIAVRDAAGNDFAGLVSFPTSTSIAAPVGVLEAGPYELAWRVVAVDGHPVEGVVRFTVASEPLPAEFAVTPGSSATAAPEVSPSVHPSPSPSSASPTVTPTSPAQGSLATGGHSRVEGSGTVVVIAVAVILFAGAIVIAPMAFLWRRRSR